jgi:hypothetical protein
MTPAQRAQLAQAGRLIEQAHDIVNRIVNAEWARLNTTPSLLRQESWLCDEDYAEALSEIADHLCDAIVVLDLRDEEVVP